jgi:RHS repeat-associated protein
MSIRHIYPILEVYLRFSLKNQYRRMTIRPKNYAAKCNTRLCFTTDNNNDGSPDVLQENHYYPFGLNINPLSKSFSNPQNNYQYNGKELTTDFGLHWNDYGARWYDAQVGRWWAVDPLGEHPNQIDKSSYAYAWD